MGSRSPAVTLTPSEGIWALSDRGVVTVPVRHAGTAQASLPGRSRLPLRRTVTFSLRGYTSGEEHVLLVGHYIVAGPQVAGHRVAWIDRLGRLRARALT
jgi:hypothetical protein